MLTTGIDIESIFPAIPQYAATWRPIYYEPIVSSGERITIAVGLLGADGVTKVVPVLREGILDCLYGDKAPNVQSFIDWAVDSLNEHLEKQRTFEGWRPPFEGIIPGILREAIGDDIENIVRQGIMTCASLSELPVENGLEEIDIEESPQSRSWSLGIRNLVAASNASLVEFFDVKTQLTTSKRKTQFNFLHKKYTSNFTVINAAVSSNDVDKAKAKLFDLENHKKGNQHNPIELSDNYELIIRVPLESEIQLTKNRKESINDTLYMLHEFANRENISIFEAHSQQQVARQILNKVA